MRMRKLSIILLISLSACKTQAPAPITEVDRWKEQAEHITIFRDDYGVPHIYGETDADAVFGLLYAQCEDDFARVERNYVWAIGRLAEVEGEDELYSDLRARLFMTQEEAIANYNKSPEWLKKLCNAFADGINYYLHTHPEVKPKLLTRFEPWMPMYFSEGSIGGDIERVSTRRIKAFYENQTALNETKEDEYLAQSLIPEEPAGSNGIAISGKLTESGNTLLLINPHTSFYFRGEVHVVSEEGLNAYGAVTWGQFFVYQGFNEKTGWMHTSTYTDVIDEFVEEVEKKEGTFIYEYGEEERKVEQIPVSLKYKDGEGLKEKSFTMYRTHHGPVTHMTDDKWTSTALMWKPVEALTQSYTRTKLNNHDEFREMMDMQTNSSNNTVYADASGNIAYYHGNFIPKRNTKFNYWEPVDGSDPETDWQGLHPVEDAITLLNPPNGWIQNCNSTPFTAAAEYSPQKEDYPPYMYSAPENFRGIHAIRLLKDSEGWTMDKLIDMAYDPYLPAFEKLIPSLIDAYNKYGKGFTHLYPAKEVLRKWDFATSKESVAMSLAHFFGMACYRSGLAPRDLDYTKRLLWYAEQAPPKELLKLFQQAVEKIEEDFGQWDTQWGEINRFQRLSGDIDASFDDSKPSLPVGLTTALWGALAAYGMRGSHDVKRIYGTRGNSFVAVVEFGEKVKAKSILAGGQSGDPNSPHFMDQAQPYIDVQFKDVAFYREDVESRSKEIYHPGYR